MGKREGPWRTKRAGTHEYCENARSRVRLHHPFAITYIPSFASYSIASCLGFPPFFFFLYGNYKKCIDLRFLGQTRSFSISLVNIAKAAPRVEQEEGNEGIEATNQSDACSYIIDS